MPIPLTCSRRHALLLAACMLGCIALRAQAARQAAEYVQKHAERWGLEPQDLQQLETTDAYTSQGSGITHVYLRQQHQGIPLREGVLAVHMDASGRIVAAHHGDAVSGLSGKAAGLQALIGPAEAAYAALRQAGLPELALAGQPAGRSPIRYEWHAPELASRPLQISKYYHVPDSGGLALIWEVEIDLRDGTYAWTMGVDAASGSIRYQYDRMLHCGWPAAQHAPHPEAAHQHAPSDEIHTGGAYRVFPAPVESPLHGSRLLAGDPADPQASPFGWHDINGVPGAEYTITRGNNVYASEDQDGNNLPGYAPDGGPGLQFDFPLDLAVSPALSQDAILTNLFYWNNVMHDVWYQYGFDEVSGNFQHHTYGRGGWGGDAVLADAMDGSGYNNANFTPAPDGQSPRIQTFLWTHSSTPLPRDLSILSPGLIAGLYENRRAAFGPPVPQIPITGQLILAEDASGNNQGCQAFTNAFYMPGKIAVVDRGGCNFAVKVKHAQNAGARAVVIFNNSSAMVTPFGADASITIPAIMVSQQDGNLIRPWILPGVTATLQADLPSGIPSDLDNGVVAHEYGHGITTRLAGGPGNISCLLNEEQPGEGWSDWLALVMTAEPGDAGTDARGIGAFPSGQSAAGIGVRPYYYSTDFQVNPVTYDYIKYMTVPHGVGFVMGSMLWDLYWKLADAHGYDPDLHHGTGGNNLAMQLVIDGLKLQPCSPGFADVRDAVLLADRIRNGGANECLIWEVFARRGLGYSADQGDPDSRSDGVQAFDLPPGCRKILYLAKTADLAEVRAGDTISYRIEAANRKPERLTGIAVRDTLPQGMAYVPGSASPPLADSAGGVLVWHIDTLHAGESQVLRMQAVTGAAVPASSFQYEDDFEHPPSVPYATEALAGTGVWSRSTSLSYSGQAAFFVPNLPARNDQIFRLPAQTLAPDAALSFWQAYDTEAGWDGGLVEILTPGAAGWQDLGPHMISGGYNAAVGFSNPAGERAAFSGRSGGFVQTRISLAAFAGQQASLRFRFVSDNNGGAGGWHVDDIRIGREARIVNRACAASAEGDAWCAEQVPASVMLAPLAGTGTEPGSGLAFRILPNPARSRALVAFGEALRWPLRAALSDMQGREVLQAGASAGMQEIELDLSRLPAGVYVLQLHTPAGAAYAKLICE
ncbi:MAG: M36 family metallopeptidase [Bacteroidia bacterium]|nr:M36 family metallopeptidase [Bacteroidia bacterium]